MGKKVGVILSGAGYLDGAELQESVLTLLALDRAGAEAQCFAPDVPQMHVVNHLSGEATGETRNVLVEAARVARGRVRPLSECRVEELDALVFPGGFGVAKNLADFAVKGPGCDILPDAQRVIEQTVAAGKPLGVICISPAIAARALRDSGRKVTLTIGNDAGTAAAVDAMGACHQECAEGEIVEDVANKVVSTPAYMYHSRISTVARGIDKLVARVLELA